MNKAVLQQLGESPTLSSLKEAQTTHPSLLLDRRTLTHALSMSWPMDTILHLVEQMGALEEEDGDGVEEGAAGEEALTLLGRHCALGEQDANITDSVVAALVQKLSVASVYNSVAEGDTLQVLGRYCSEQTFSELCKKVTSGKVSCEMHMRLLELGGFPTLPLFHEFASSHPDLLLDGLALAYALKSHWCMDIILYLVEQLDSGILSEREGTVGTRGLNGWVGRVLLDLLACHRGLGSQTKAHVVDRVVDMLVEKVSATSVGECLESRQTFLALGQCCSETTFGNLCDKIACEEVPKTVSQERYGVALCPSFWKMEGSKAEMVFRLFPEERRPPLDYLRSDHMDSSNVKLLIDLCSPETLISDEVLFLLSTSRDFVSAFDKVEHLLDENTVIELICESDIIHYQDNLAAALAFFVEEPPWEKMVRQGQPLAQRFVREGRASIVAWLVDTYPDILLLRWQKEEEDESLVNYLLFVDDIEVCRAVLDGLREHPQCNLGDLVCRAPKVVYHFAESRRLFLIKDVLEERPELLEVTKMNGMSTTLLWFAVLHKQWANAEFLAGLCTKDTLAVACGGDTAFSLAIALRAPTSCKAALQPRITKGAHE